MIVMTKIKRKKDVAKKERIAITRKKEHASMLASKIKGAKVIALISLQNLPDRLLQSMRKKLRGKVQIYQAKNTVIKRALEAAKAGGDITKLVNIPCALVLSELSPYQLFKFFKDNSIKVAAKPGQVAPFDIIVPAGDTDLPPGPALSELKGAGINVQLKGGKIVVAKDSVVAKNGTKILPPVAKALQKLNILPFSVKIGLVGAHEEGYLYTSQVLDIDEAGLKSDVVTSAMQGLNLSINASFPTEGSINIVLGNAFMQATNMAANGNLYTDSTIGMLLSTAAVQGLAISKQVPAGASTAQEEKKA